MALFRVNSQVNCVPGKSCALLSAMLCTFLRHIFYYYWCLGHDITLIGDHFVTKHPPSLKYEYEIKVDTLQDQKVLELCLKNLDVGA